MGDILYGRKIEVIAGVKKFDSKDFTIYFEVPFDDDKEPNIAEIEIYNLKDQTINEIKKGTKIIINAGYQNDVGSILIGEAQTIQTEWKNVDKITNITTLDGYEKWFKTPISKTYKAGIDAKRILNDLLRIGGFVIGAFKLPVNKIYKGGKTLKTTLYDAIFSIAKDCGAKVHINKGKIYIRPKNDGNNINFLLDKEHGLIGSPTPIEKEVVTGKDKKGNEIKKKIRGWKVVSLLNHRITTDVIIQIKSKTANGVYRVESGKHYHNGNAFYTEMEAYPL
jgi:hypothetical protein